MRVSYVHPPHNIESASGNHPNEKTAWMGLEGRRWRLKGLQLQDKKKRGPYAVQTVAVRPETPAEALYAKGTET